MGRRRGVFIPLPGGSGALLGSGAQAMPADFLHSTSRASNMALRPPPAVRQDGRSANFGPFRSGSVGRGWEGPSALSGDYLRSGFFVNARGRLRLPFGSALGLTRFLGKDRRGGLPRLAAAGVQGGEKDQRRGLVCERVLSCRPASKNNGNGPGACGPQSPARGGGSGEARNLLRWKEPPNQSETAG